MPRPLNCRSTVIANQPRSALSFETLHPLYLSMLRSILCNAPSFVTLHDWNAKSKDSGFQGIWRFSVDWHFTVDLQIGGCGKCQDSANVTIGVIDHMRQWCVWEDRHFKINLQITWCGNLHERAFHAGSEDVRMGSFHALPELLTSVLSHIVNFSIFLSVRNYNDPQHVIGP